MWDDLLQDVDVKLTVEIGSTRLTLRELLALGEAAAFESSDYKALVCVFLHGGNDGNNLLLPYEPDDYALYSQARGILGLARVRGLASGLPVGGDLEYADEVTLGRAFEGRRSV